MGYVVCTGNLYDEVLHKYAQQLLLAAVIFAGMSRYPMALADKAVVCLMLC